ncbi:MAG: hypothetical protein GXP33_00700, partial [Spirochaetes bacterium]|nr:hypothetical protein [Spirochaetota bacterium]
MLNIEEVLVAFDTDLTNCPTNTNFNVSTLDGKIGILSFLDWDNGWNWLRYLNILRLDSKLATADYHFMTVIFSTSKLITCSPITALGIRKRLNNDPVLSGADFSSPISSEILLDSTDLIYPAKNAKIYKNGFGVLDTQFHSPTFNGMWTYITGKNNLITDKWHNDAANKGPISFNRITEHVARIQLNRLSDINSSVDLDLTLPGVTGTIRIQYTHNVNPDNALYEYTVDLSHNGMDFVYPFSKIKSTGTEGIVEIAIYYGEDIAGADDQTNYVLSNTTDYEISGFIYEQAAFDPGDFACSAAYLKRRLINLNNAPKYLSVNPQKNTTIRRFPVPGNDVSFVFSKPVFAAGGSALAKANFTVTGGGVGQPSGPSYDSLEYTGIEKIENAGHFVFTAGSLDDASSPVTIQPVNADDNYPAPGPAAFTEQIIYNVDSTAPVLNSF